MKNVIELAKARFKLDINGTHGLAHWQRVEARGLEIAQHTNANINVVRHFAYLHDACRENEDDDPDHGKRAAVWVDTLLASGQLPLLDYREKVLLKYAIYFHNTGRVVDTPTIGTCWDADRADLIRCHMIPSERFMSTAYGKQLTKELYEQE